MAANSNRLSNPSCGLQSAGPMNPALQYSIGSGSAKKKKKIGDHDDESEDSEGSEDIEELSIVEKVLPIRDGSNPSLKLICQEL
jgi:hypothetical protein